MADSAKENKTSVKVKSSLGQGNKASEQPPVKFDFFASRLLVSWMQKQKVSFAVTTYQIGKLFFIGADKEGQLSVFNRTIDRCVGMCGTNQVLYVSSAYQLHRFENALLADQDYQGYDRVFVPQLSYITGDIDMHDIGVDEQGQPIFVNTLFSCLATVSETHSFLPLWKPPFITKLAPEDRCHLNGLAMQDGKPAYVTTVSQTDINEGWREHRASGGTLIDVEQNKIILDDLSMPHSPRIYQNKLWLLESGSGYLCYVEFKRRKAKLVRFAFCPGYLRGLAFVGNYAIVGLSKQRQNRTFSGLALDNNLAKFKVKPRCGLVVVDLKNGDLLHNLYFEGIMNELYDVVAFPGVNNPMALGFQGVEIRHHISMPETDLSK